MSRTASPAGFTVTAFWPLDAAGEPVTRLSACAEGLRGSLLEAGTSTDENFSEWAFAVKRDAVAFEAAAKKMGAAVLLDASAGEEARMA